MACDGWIYSDRLLVVTAIPGDDSRMGLLYERDGPLCTAANDSKLPSVACNIVFTTFPADFK